MLSIGSSPSKGQYQNNNERSGPTLYTNQSNNNMSKLQDQSQLGDTIDQDIIQGLNSSIFQAAEIQNRIKKVQQLEKSPLVDNYGSINEPHAHPYGIMSGLTESALRSGLGFSSQGNSVEASQQLLAMPDVCRGYGNQQSQMIDSVSQMRLDNNSNFQPKKVNLASAMHMDRIYPINMSFRHGQSEIDNQNQTTRDSQGSLMQSKRSHSNVKDLSQSNLKQLPSIQFQKVSGIRLNQKLSARKQQKEGILKGLTGQDGYAQSTQLIEAPSAPSNLPDTSVHTEDRQNQAQVIMGKSPNIFQQQVPGTHHSSIQQFNTTSNQQSKMLFNEKPAEKSNVFVSFDNLNNPKTMDSGFIQAQQEYLGMQFISQPQMTIDHNIGSNRLLDQQKKVSSGVFQTASKESKFRFNSQVQAATGFKSLRNNSLTPNEMLNKFTHIRENQNIPKLSKLMDNKKYFHKAPDRQMQSDRVSLMNSGVLNDQALDFSYISNKDEFNKAIQWSLKIPQGGNKTQYKRGIGHLAGQTVTPNRGLAQKSDMWSDRMAQTKQRRGQNNSVDFGGYGTVPQFGNFEANKLSAPDANTFGYPQVMQNENEQRLPDIGAQNIQVQNTNRNNQSVQFVDQVIEEEGTMKESQISSRMQMLPDISQQQTQMLMEYQNSQNPAMDYFQMIQSNPNLIQQDMYASMSSMNQSKKRSDMNYKDLLKKFQKIQPGGVGGKMKTSPSYWTQKEEARVREDEAYEQEFMDEDEFEQTPFVNRSPDDKKLSLGNDGFFKTKHNHIQQEVFQNANSSLRTSIGRRGQMEKIQLQLILDKLSNLEKTRASNGANKQKKKKRSVTSNKKKEDSQIDIQKAKEQDEQNKLIAEFLKPIEYKGDKITTYNDILKHLSLDCRDDTATFAQQFQKDKDSKEAYRLATDEFVKILDALHPPNISNVKMSTGDWYIYLKRVHKHNFSIEHDAKLRKHKFEQIAYEQAKQDMQARQGGKKHNTDPSLSQLPGSNSVNS